MNDGRPVPPSPLSFEFNHSLRAGITQPFDTSSFTLAQILRFRTLAAAGEYLIWSSAREADDNAYLFTGPVDQSGYKMWLRVKDINPGGTPGDNNFLSDRSPSINNSYISLWRTKDVGDATSAEHRLNGVDGVVTPGSGLVHNKGPADVRGRQNVTLGSLVRTNTSTTFFDGLIASACRSTAIDAASFVRECRCDSSDRRPVRSPRRRDSPCRPRSSRSQFPRPLAARSRPPPAR